MDERRDTDPAAGSRPPLAARVRLSPVQEAWARYVDHALACLSCRSLGAGRCVTAERLHQAYEEQADGAFRRLGEAGTDAADLPQGQ